MQFLDTIFVMAVSALSLLIIVRGVILQRQKHWNRVWERLGKPGVAGIKELKALNNRQRRAEMES